MVEVADKCCHLYKVVMVNVSTRKLYITLHVTQSSDVFARVDIPAFHKGTWSLAC